MDLIHTITLLALGAFLGTVGQGVRAVVGITKEMVNAKDAKAAGKPVPDWFNGNELGISLMIGAIAGCLAAVLQCPLESIPSKDILFGFVGAGYAGTDFITGLMQKWLPKT